MSAPKTISYRGAKYVLAWAWDKNVLDRRKELQALANKMKSSKDGIVGDGFYFRFHSKADAQAFTDKVKALGLATHEVHQTIAGWQAYVPFQVTHVRP